MHSDMRVCVYFLAILQRITVKIFYITVQSGIINFGFKSDTIRVTVITENSTNVVWRIGIGSFNIYNFLIGVYDLHNYGATGIVILFLGLFTPSR